MKASYGHMYKVTIAKFCPEVIISVNKNYKLSVDGQNKDVEILSSCTTSGIMQNYGE